MHRGDNGPQKRTRPVYPQVREIALDHGWAEGTGGVKGCSREGDPDEVAAEDGEPDGEGRDDLGAVGVNRGAENGEHEHECEDGFYEDTRGGGDSNTESGDT